MITHVIGNALEPIETVQPLIIAHVTNSFGSLGAGFALQLAKRWPAVAAEYAAWERQNSVSDMSLLGQVHTSQVEQGHQKFIIANMCAQTLGRRFNLSMPALEICIQTVGTLAASLQQSVHAPRIASGLAGGRWADIVRLIPPDWTIYTLPAEVEHFPAESEYLIHPGLVEMFGGLKRVDYRTALYFIRNGAKARLFSNAKPSPF